jgi:hypothetical protein
MPLSTLLFFVSDPVVTCSPEISTHYTLQGGAQHAATQQDSS